MNTNLPNLLPGNIKQKLVPFVLNPGKADTVVTAKGNKELENAYPQVFTYKATEYGKEFPQAQLSFMPKAFKDVVKRDISYKLLYNDSNIANYKSNADKLTYKTIFNNIPGVQIREFLPDTKLDQLITAIGSLLDQIGKMFENKTLTDIGAEFVKSLESVTSKISSMDINAFNKFGSYLVDYLLNVNSNEKSVGKGTASTFVNDLFTNGMTDKFKYAYTDNTGSCQLNAMALKIPYMLYYGLQSTTTTNIYEVPFVNEPKLLYTSAGSSGWGDSAGFISHILDSAKSILGSIIPNIGISMTPWWNTSSGQGTFEDEAVVNFDLYNDSKDQAMINFIFVNTIIPNNKWLQYGLIQHSPCLYDVKVEGIKRMYACTGDFKVTYSGVLRKVTKQFIDDLILKHLNASFAWAEEETQLEGDKTINVIKRDEKIGSFINEFKDNIRIPDVYHVSLTFKSLLPSNLNQYLFQYIGNTNIVNQVAVDHARPVNVVENITAGIGNVTKSLGSILQQAINERNVEAAKEEAAKEEAEFNAQMEKAMAEGPYGSSAEGRLNTIIPY